MSTTRIKGKIAFICDDCDDHLETESGDFATARETMREAGWKTVQPTPGIWENRCVGCAGGRRQPNFRSQRRDLG